MSALGQKQSRLFDYSPVDLPIGKMSWKTAPCAFPGDRHRSSLVRNSIWTAAEELSRCMVLDALRRVNAAVVRRRTLTGPLPRRERRFIRSPKRQ
jgi:hypothetical protein